MPALRLGEHSSLPIHARPGYGARAMNASRSDSPPIPITDTSTFAPFRVRSFRFQWPADLCASLAFESENIILAWYVLIETRSVFMLTVYASLAYIGTLLAPMFGVMGDRVGQRNLLLAMRCTYAALGSMLLVLALSGVLIPVYVIIIAALMGLVRPSDIGVRNALMGVTIPGPQLMGAMGIQRITQDSARVAGALTGAGAVALVGMGPAYLLVVIFYVASVVLTISAGSSRTRSVHRLEPERASPWRDLKEGAVYVWNTPHLRALMLLALVLNGTAFPLSNALMPYVVKTVYGADQATLGSLVACGALGALFGSVLTSRQGTITGAARQMIICSVGWYVMLFLFAQIERPHLGMLVLFVSGCIQAAGLVPMSGILLRNSDARFHGRVMGIRMLALYSNLPGLLLAGPLITRIGYAGAASLYCLVGLVFTAWITLHWRAALWDRAASTNRG